MTTNHTTTDDATDANTLNADALIDDAQRQSMEPRTLTPWQQEEANAAMAQLETFVRFSAAGTIRPHVVLTIEQMATDYLNSIPTGQRRPSIDRAKRDIAKSIVNEAFDQAYRIGRVSLSTDPADYDERGFSITCEVPELVWYEKDESSAAAARGEVAWCYLYWPDAREVPNPDPHAPAGSTVLRPGLWNHRGLTGITKTYSDFDDAEADMLATRRAVAVLRRLSEEVNAPDDDDDDTRPAPPIGRPRVPLT